MDKKTFALEQIVPYYKNPSLCGYNNTTKICEYITKDLRMCVMGKNLLHPEEFIEVNADTILLEYGEGVLKPESRGILSANEWMYLQQIHDNIAMNDEFKMKNAIDNLNLFTLQELKDYEL